mmetsp:Transcript_20870/g.42982  ORF Transcript_20870/g.42982 Transcript_20870/m.42982 type:complete len:205 (-) Transcript_20870:297-911(-)
MTRTLMAMVLLLTLLVQQILCFSKIFSCNNCWRSNKQLLAVLLGRFGNNMVICQVLKVCWVVPVQTVPRRTIIFICWVREEPTTQSHPRLPHPRENQVILVSFSRDRSPSSPNPGKKPDQKSRRTNPSALYRRTTYFSETNVPTFLLTFLIKTKMKRMITRTMTTMMELMVLRRKARARRENVHLTERLGLKVSPKSLDSAGRN